MSRTLDPRLLAAVLVVYHPADDPKGAVARLLCSVSHVVLVDNTPHRTWYLQEAAMDVEGVHVIHNANRGGLAGAYNQALAWISQSLPDVMHVLFLDQDSDMSALDEFLSDAQTQRALDLTNTATCAAAYCDRSTLLRARYVRLTKLGFSRLPREFSGVREVGFVINSMSVWPLRALQRIGPFNEGLGVDQVDTEYCLRAHLCGLKVYVNGDQLFVHTIGQRHAKRILGLTVQSGGHSAQRRFFIGRNLAWLARTYAFKRPAFAWLCLCRFVYELAGIVLVEREDRTPKLSRLVSGFFRGIGASRLTFNPDEAQAAGPPVSFHRDER